MKQQTSSQIKNIMHAVNSLFDTGMYRNTNINYYILLSTSMQSVISYCWVQVVQTDFMQHNFISAWVVFLKGQSSG